MDAFDDRGLVIAALRQRTGAKLNERVTPARFNCIRQKHSSTQSAWIGDHAWGCYACGVDGDPLHTLAADLGVELPKRGGLTVAEYAEHKRFNAIKLQAWHVSDMQGKYGAVVAFAYLDAEGNHLRTKYRVRGGQDRPKTFWLDDGAGVHLYGLWQLAKYPTEPVILVEGESDCHAAWHHGVLAIGVPGAGVWKTEWAPLLESRQVYVWQEPGEAASKMVKKLAADLPHAMVIDNGGVKDLADLHKDVGRGFRAAVVQRLERAYPIHRLPPVVTFDPILGDTLDRVKAEKLKPVDAVPTPLPLWNTHCRDAGGGIGLARGWHIIIAGKTGHGKSLVALNIAAHAVQAGERVSLVNLEMSFEQSVTRFMSIFSGERIRDLERGSSFNSDTWTRIGRQLAEVHERTGGVLRVNRARVRSLEDVVGAIEYEHEVYGSRFVIIDYLQLARATSKSERESELLQQMTAVSDAIVSTAVRLNLVSVALSQFNRQTSAAKEAPTPQGLMGGSPLENDSDQIVLLDHSQYAPNPAEQSATTQLILGKNRHGGMGVIPVRWDYRTLQLRELAKAHAAAVTTKPPRRTGRDAALPDEDRGEAWEQPGAPSQEFDFGVGGG